MIKVSMLRPFFLSNLLEAIAEAMMAIKTTTVTMTIEQFLVGRTHGTGRLPGIHSRVHQSANGSAQDQRLGPRGQNERYFLNCHYRNFMPVPGQVAAYANGTKKTVA
jgi:hypothetical protein